MIYEGRLTMKDPQTEAWWKHPLEALVKAFESRPAWLKNLMVTSIVFVVLFTVSFYFVGDKIITMAATVTAEKIMEDNLDLTPAEKEKMAQNNVEIKKAENAIISEESAHLAYLNSTFRREIQKMFDYISYRHPECVGVNYWTVHNGGKTTKINVEAVLEVHISSNLKNEAKFGEKAPSIYNGFRWLADELIVNETNEFYAHDVMDFPQINNGEAKKTMLSNETVCFYAAMIKNEGTVQHFVSMDFNVTEIKTIKPDTYNDFIKVKDLVREKLFYGFMGLDD